MVDENRNPYAGGVTEEDGWRAHRSYLILNKGMSEAEADAEIAKLRGGEPDIKGEATKELTKPLNKLDPPDIHVH